MGVDDTALASMIPSTVLDSVSASLSASSPIELKSLENVSLSYCFGVTSQGFIHFLESMGKQLREPHLNDISYDRINFNVNVFQCIAHKLVNLEELSWLEVYFDTFYTDNDPELCELQNLQRKMDQVAKEWKFITRFNSDLGQANDLVPGTESHFVKVTNNHAEFSYRSNVDLSLR
ncbi:hypothetical protein BDA99DRAFT_544510 [Phascolomyces articulosus]|uniref:Uncharacterized protein n=1 Tax=Phascolomyces articulosus TaxID=60185 RepID=A0AAD5JVT1_9FUNG|nr:hypothetical protein BDA99DRAFT_544510 [Phascolomyces articulosus]